MRNVSIILLLALFFSCKDSGKEKIVDILAEWQDKEIKFPEKVTFTRFGKDTLDYTLPSTKYKILVYVDSIGCTGCKLQLPRWKSFIQELNSACKDTVPVLLFFHPFDKKELQYLLKQEKYSLPVCVDKKDSLNKLNNFPAIQMLQTFLLDKDNKVKAMGNPIYNTKVKDLYLKILTGKPSSQKTYPETTIAIDKTQVDFGTFDSKSTKEAIFHVKNTGTSSLVILDLITSCGCTTVEYDKSPAAPSDSLKIKVLMTPKEEKIFEETITVKCNASSSPVKLLIKGHAHNE